MLTSLARYTLHMRPLLAIVLILLAACGVSRPNKLLGAPSRLASLRLPHEAIYVKTFRGIVRVQLDTGDTELVAHGRDALAVDDRTSVGRRHGRFVVREGAGEREVPELVAPQTGDMPALSPDRTRFAVAQDPDGPKVDDSVVLAVVELADLSVRRFPVAGEAYSLAWSPDGGELRFELWDQRVGFEHFRLVLATGAIDKVARATVDAERQVVRDAPGESACPARKHQLTTDTEGDRQRIVIVPLPDPADPDKLSTLKPRVLVQATDHHWHPHSGGEPPARFGSAIFTSSCDHFVFELGGQIYVGEVATGRFAFLAIGSDPARTLPLD